MSTVELHQAVANFSAQASGGEQVQLTDLAGKRVVLYFYPKDATPGCTLESQQFRDLHAEFNKLNTVILGISRDSVKSHDKFVAKECLPFALLSDSDEAICRQFDVIKTKNMYGKMVEGIERSTFVIDEHGVLIQAWRKVKADGHAAEVLAFLQGLSG